MAKPLVVIFARRPRYGAVKTRLARDIGDGEALRFHRNVLTRLVRAIAGDARFEAALAVTPDAALRDPGLRQLGVGLAAQGAGDLGRRMIRALRSGGARPVMVIGSDIPALAPRHLVEAVHALGRAPVVMGPARDGGYWLIGARHPMRLRPDALDGVRWSSRNTLSDSAARLGRVAILDTVLDDVDDGASYSRLQTTAFSASTRRSTSASSW
jgi:rSAM/selenodomain-associated transferase 1